MSLLELDMLIIHILCYPNKNDALLICLPLKLLILFFNKSLKAETFLGHTVSPMGNKVKIVKRGRIFRITLKLRK